MRVRYSFSSRRTGTLARDNQHRKEFPEIARQVISQADMILEVLDSRFWQETRNLELEGEILKLGKKLVFVLNKSDLVDKKKLAKQMKDNYIYPYALVSCKDRKGSKELRERIKIEKRKINKEKVQVGVIGYPNTGKSSIINILIGKQIARASSEAGFTKGVQKLKLAEGIFLLDTPGVIPESENPNISSKDLIKHAQINARSWNKVKEPEMILHSLIKQYPRMFEKFYDIQAGGDSGVLIEKLGRKKHILKKKNLVDSDRVARMILRDFQEGKIKV